MTLACFSACEFHCVGALLADGSSFGCQPDWCGTENEDFTGGNCGAWSHPAHLSKCDCVCGQSAFSSKEKTIVRLVGVGILLSRAEQDRVKGKASFQKPFSTNW